MTMPEYAFPGLNAQFTGIDSDGQERYEVAPSGGMLLRDHFAGLAMQGFLSGAIKGSFGASYPDQNMNVAIASFAIADAMLRAREKE